MNREEIKSLAAAWQSVVEKKKLDPVGKADADIDNDGDVDNSDEYLHNRRKAIKKSKAVQEGSCGGKKKPMKEQACEQCGEDPCECKQEQKEAYRVHSVTKQGEKFKSGVYNTKKEALDKHWKLSKTKQYKSIEIRKEGQATKEDVQDPSIVDVAEQIEEAVQRKHHSIASAYKEVWEASDRAKHYRGATKPEPWIDNESPKSKAFVAAHNKNVDEDDTEEEGHKDVVKAGAPAMKQSPPRRGDNRSGDKVAQTPKDTTKNGKAQ